MNLRLKSDRYSLSYFYVSSNEQNEIPIDSVHPFKFISINNDFEFKHYQKHKHLIEAKIIKLKDFR